MVTRSRLGWYLTTSVIRSILAVSAVLVGLYLGVDFVREAGDMNERYRLLEIGGFLLRTLPARLYDLFPFAALIGTIVALGRLAAGSELIAMRACGFDQPRIAGRALLASLSLGLLVMWAGETVAPRLELEARIDREQAQERQVGGTGSSLWLRDGSRMVRAGLVLWESDDRVRFAELQVYELDGQDRIERVLHAASARHIAGRWSLTGAVVLDAVDGSRQPHERPLAIESELDPDVFRALATRPRLLPIRDILRIRNYLRENGQDTTGYDQALWRRTLYPLNLLAMVFSGLALLLKAGRRLPPALGVFAGVSLGIAFVVVHRLVLGTAPVLPVPLWLTHLVPAALFAALGVLMLRR